MRLLLFCPLPSYLSLSLSWWLLLIEPLSATVPICISSYLIVSSLKKSELYFSVFRNYPIFWSWRSLTTSELVRRLLRSRRRHRLPSPAKDQESLPTTIRMVRSDRTWRDLTVERAWSSVTWESSRSFCLSLTPWLKSSSLLQWPSKEELTGLTALTVVSSPSQGLSFPAMGLVLPVISPLTKTAALEGY